MQEKNVWYVFRFYNSTFHLCGHTSYSSVGCERLFELPWRQHTRKYYRVEHLNQEVTPYNISSFGNWLNTKNTNHNFSMIMCWQKTNISVQSQKYIYTQSNIWHIIANSAFHTSTGEKTRYVQWISCMSTCTLFYVTEAL